MLPCNTRLTLLPESAADNLGGDDTFAGHQGSADGGGVRQLMVLLAPAGDVTRLGKQGGWRWLRMPAAGLQLEAAEPLPGKPRQPTCLFFGLYPILRSKDNAKWLPMME